MTEPTSASSGAIQKAADETLRDEYQEICRSHQAITDFRGKLLGLLPLATGGGIFLLLDKPIRAQPTMFLITAGVFGVLVTIGLYFYEFRGMIECHLLRERGANLERELQLSTNVSRFQENHPGWFGPRGAGPMVYFAVVAAWLFLSVHGLISSDLGLEQIIGICILVGYLITVHASAAYFKRHHETTSKR